MPQGWKNVPFFPLKYGFIFDKEIQIIVPHYKNISNSFLISSSNWTSTFIDYHSVALRWASRKERDARLNFSKCESSKLKKIVFRYELIPQATSLKSLRLVVRLKQNDIMHTGRQFSRNWISFSIGIEVYQFCAYENKGT